MTDDTTADWDAYMTALDAIAPIAQAFAHAAPHSPYVARKAATLEKIRAGLELRARQTAPSDAGATPLANEAQKPLAPAQNAPRRRMAEKQGAML